ncbi:hypothetical protein WKC52_19760 [Morganella morganii]|uniref:hypothetical protein n=1 Tax=Morganella morganii TaxID=582 RepID=UPI00311A597A
MPVTVQVTGTRERAALTDAVRAELTAQGVLHGSPVSVTLLTPVWSDSKTRQDISQYREGMILEQWQDGKKSAERFTVSLGDASHAECDAGRQPGTVSGNKGHKTRQQLVIVSSGTEKYCGRGNADPAGKTRAAGCR